MSHGDGKQRRVCSLEARHEGNGAATCQGNLLVQLFHSLLPQGGTKPSAHDGISPKTPIAQMY